MNNLEWSTKTVEEICERVSVGIVIKPSQYYTDADNGIRAFRSANVQEGGVQDSDWVYLTKAGHKANKKSELMEGDVLVVRSGEPGTACVVPKQYAGANCIDIVFARPKKSIVVPEYLAAFTNSSVGKKHVLDNKGGLALKHFNVGAYKSMSILLPPLREQRRITEILRTWDEAIEKLEARRCAEKRRYEAIVQQIFEASFRHNENLIQAKQLFEPVSERKGSDLPLLAVMQDIGVVRRDALERRVVMPDGDITSYKVTRPGDFIISLRSFEGGLEYSGLTGLVSPAYTVLRPKKKIDDEYYQSFFKSRSFIGRLDKMIFGIRDGKQIAFRDFGDMKLPCPPLSEQQRYAHALSACREAMNKADHALKAVEKQKRGLMQKLLTGEWRVKC